MSSPPPTKPPRGVKQARETSGLLMSVIRSLSASETIDQREKEKSKLEREYLKSDEKLNELVTEHADEIRKVMEIYNSVYGALSTCRSRLHASRGRLTACRTLLEVRRDDLRRLYALAAKHKHALHMLTCIEQLVSVEGEVSRHMSRGHYLSAAAVLQAALRLAHTELAPVSALNHLRIDLQGKKETLVEKTLQALSDAVYRAEVASLRRQASCRERAQDILPLIIGEITKSDRLSDESLQEVNPEYELSLTEEEKTFKITLAILIEALAVLDQIKEATEKLKVQIQTELLQIIAVVSQQVMEEGAAQLGALGDCVDGAEGDSIELQENIDPQFQLLTELLTSLLESYRLVAQRQKVMLDIWKQTLYKHNKNNVQLHSMQHYWNGVQAVLQLLLTDYLDMQNLTTPTQRPSFTEQTTTADINSYFLKKSKTQTKKRVRLFKFNQSEQVQTTALSLNRSMETIISRGKTYQLVCRPNPENLPYIYPILDNFMNEIESNTGTRECSLRAFISDHIRSAETERLSGSTRAAIDACMKEPGAWREITAPSPPPHSASDKYMIYTCVVRAWECVCRVRWWWSRVGGAGGGGEGALHAALHALHAHCRAAHAHMQPHARSARWLADDDIVRFLKSLSNWRALKNPPKKKLLNSDQDIKQSYEKEAETLGNNLGDGRVSHAEVIANTNTLRELAIMCESMEWVSGSIRAIPSSLSASNGHAVRLSERAVAELNTIAALFEDIADSCLLLLHLELRIQCFYYLGQEEWRGVEGASAGGGGALELGGAAGQSGAARLAHALLTFHEDCAPLLHPANMMYIIGGLGEMMSAGLVWRWQEGSLSGGSSGGAGQLGTLRHCLAALHLPPHGLHRAHAYTDLCTMQPQEVLTIIKEKGPQFSELEYLNAFKIIAKAKKISDSELEHYMNKLSMILGNVGVTV